MNRHDNDNGLFHVTARDWLLIGLAIFAAACFVGWCIREAFQLTTAMTGGVI